MARDSEEEIREEEDWEAEDADDIEEQELPKEYEDAGGESTAPHVGVRASGIEYLCLTCGRKQIARGGIVPKCHGLMTAMDFERTPKPAMPPQSATRQAKGSAKKSSSTTRTATHAGRKRK